MNAIDKAVARWYDDGDPEAASGILARSTDDRLEALRRIGYTKPAHIAAFEAEALS